MGAIPFVRYSITPLSPDNLPAPLLRHSAQTVRPQPPYTMRKGSSLVPTCPRLPQAAQSNSGQWRFVRGSDALQMRLKKACVVSEPSTYSAIDDFIQSCFFLSDSLAGRSKKNATGTYIPSANVMMVYSCSKCFGHDLNVPSPNMSWFL
ncbi:hypothetical protein RRG08_053524 [Elysia crispata]|uniref:Uncharacterized protein n=1 Tax=Elysia crispata TaxID=231223 RepID=A0AAE0YBS5_9GAST|nr:hypothetical protein RRG08_053524 [Elysia crispata]